MAIHAEALPSLGAHHPVAEAGATWRIMGLSDLAIKVISYKWLNYLFGFK